MYIDKEASKRLGVTVMRDPNEKEEVKFKAEPKELKEEKKSKKEKSFLRDEEE